MAHVEKSVLVPHRAATIFGLVDDVERYPEFLPWCGGARIVRRDAVLTVASLVIRYAGVTQAFTTENTREGEEYLRIKLVDGPFHALHGHWRFRALADVGAKIEFVLDYRFENTILEAAIGPVFNMIADTMVDRFVARADALAARA